MTQQPTYYTVIIGKRSCIVKYATPPDYSVKLFSQSFPDPDRAHLEMKLALEGKLLYLAEGAFDRKVSQLSSQYQLNMAKLAAWQEGKPIRI